MHFKPQPGSEERSEAITEGLVEVVALVVSVAVEEAAMTSRKAARIRRIQEAIVIIIGGERT